MGQVFIMEIEELFNVLLVLVRTIQGIPRLVLGRIYMELGGFKEILS